MLFIYSVRHLLGVMYDHPLIAFTFHFMVRSVRDNHNTILKLCIWNILFTDDGEIDAG